MKIIIALLMMIVSNSHAQVKGQTDSVKIDWNCDKIFIRCEEPPTLRNGASTYQMLLTDHLNRNNQVPASGKAVLNLIISKNGQVENVEVKENSIADIKILIAAMKAITNQWRPAKQNDHLICAYKEIAIEVVKNELLIQLRD